MLGYMIEVPHLSEGCSGKQCHLVSSTMPSHYVISLELKHLEMRASVYSLQQLQRQWKRAMGMFTSDGIYQPYRHIGVSSILKELDNLGTNRTFASL